MDAPAANQMRIETERLVLRPWLPDDLPLIAHINQDPQVCEFFPASLTDQQSFAAVERYRTSLARDGFGMLAAELKDTQEFIGILGMQTMTLEVPSLTKSHGLAISAVEIGWRLAPAHWGRGLATEGGQAVIDYAFAVVRLSEVVAMTAAINKRSRSVMRKLGMTHCQQLDFDHPLVAAGNPLSRHVVYKRECCVGGQ